MIEPHHTLDLAIVVISKTTKAIKMNNKNNIFITIIYLHCLNHKHACCFSSKEQRYQGDVVVVTFIHSFINTDSEIKTEKDLPELIKGKAAGRTYCIEIVIRGIVVVVLFFSKFLLERAGRQTDDNFAQKLRTGARKHSAFAQSPFTIAIITTQTATPTIL
jgi:hypothetical protein